jgi:hypothetical protein
MRQGLAWGTCSYFGPESKQPLPAFRWVAPMIMAVRSTFRRYQSQFGAFVVSRCVGFLVFIGGWCRVFGALLLPWFKSIPVSQSNTTSDGTPESTKSSKASESNASWSGEGNFRSATLCAFWELCGVSAAVCWVHICWFWDLGFAL